MKMREYVDGIKGPGYWDRMHDAIAAKDIFSWEMPAVNVDGHDFHIFPGTDREVTLDAVQRELRKAINSIGPIAQG